MQEQNEGLLDYIGKIANHLESVAPNKRVSQHEYNMARAKRNKLTRTVYMGGVRVSERQLSDAQIGLLNQLQPGKYNKNKWTVLFRDGGSDDGGSLDILRNNATQEQRMADMTEAPTLDILCQKIIAEQKANVGK